MTQAEREKFEQTLAYKQRFQWAPIAQKKRRLLGDVQNDEEEFHEQKPFQDPEDSVMQDGDTEELKEESKTPSSGPYQIGKDGHITVDEDQMVADLQMCEKIKNFSKFQGKLTYI